MCRHQILPSSAGSFLFALLFSLCSFSVAVAESETASVGLGFQSGPEIRTEKLPLADIGRFYSTQLEAVDDWAVVRWSVEGDLPPGLGLDPVTGVLSGTPETFGRYEFTLRLTDSLGATVEKAFEFYVLNVVKDPASLSPIVTPAAQPALRLAPSAAPAALAAPQAGPGPDLSGLLDILEATAEGDWVQVNANFYEDVWAPPDLQPLKGLGPSSPSSIIGAWSSFAWDSRRGDLLLYGGGHANSSGNDMYRWRGTTRLWERASLPSEIKEIDPVRHIFTAIDGADAAPSSAHTYDNSVYLPLVDRFLTFGGAGYNHGGAYARETAAGTATTGPYLFNPALADPDKVGGTTGSHVQRSGPHPEIIGGEMWENRDGYSYFSGSASIPASFVSGASGYTEENGKDVVYVSARSGSTAQALYRYVLNDIDDPSADSWEMVGRYWNGGSDQGAGAYHPGLNIFVRTSDEKFLYWDLSTPGPYNNDVVFVPNDPGGDFDLSILRRHGMDYDPVGEQFMLWGGGGAVWALEPPATVGVTGWNLVKQPTPGSSVPDIDVGTGVLGKWEYVPNLDAFITLQGSYAGNIWLYKPVGWVRPGTDTADTDGDGMPDAFEIQYGFDINDPNDAAEDFDGDGLTNLEEYQLGTDPTVPDVLVPGISLSSPAEGAEFISGSDISLEAVLVGDANATVSAVEFYVDGVLIAQDTSAPYDFTWSTTDEGPHVLSATAVDPIDGDAVSVAVNILVVPLSPGGELTLQDGVNGYAGTRDSYLSFWHPNQTFGAQALLQQQTGRYDDLIRFAVFDGESGPIPAGAQIQSAVVSIYKYTYYDHSYGLRRVLKDWDESQVSWNSASSVASWDQPGASGVGTDVAQTLDAQASAGWAPGWVDFDVTTAVQAMSNGDSNYGWKLAGLGGNGNLKRFHSSEYADDASLRPKLVISYINAGPIDKPSIAFTSPATGEEFTVGSSVSLEAAVGDDANATLTGVDFYADGVLIGQAASAPYQISWSAVAPGSYTLTATAVDPVDGDVVSAPVTVDVAAPVPPTVVLTVPVAGATFTAGVAVPLEAALGNDANATVTGVNFYADGVSIGLDSTAPYQASWSTLVPGNHTLTAMAVDPVDGDAVSIPVTIEVLAPTPPTVVLTKPANGATYAAGTAVQLEAALSDDANGSVTQVAFYANGVLLGQDATAPYQVSWDNVASGSYALTTIAVDPVDGNGTSTPVNIVVDPAPPPTIALTSPVNGAVFTAGSTIPLQANVGSDPNATVSEVAFYADGVLIGQDTSAPYEFNWSNVSEGVYQLTATVVDPVDGDGNSAPVSVEVLDQPGGGEVTLQNGVAGYAGTRDSYLSYWHDDLNFGSSSRLDHQPGRYVQLVRFDVLDSKGGPLPAGAQIQSAVLSLYKYSYYDHSFGLRRVLRDWNETQVSWNSAKSGEAWGQPGVEAVGTDVAQALDAQASTGWLPEWVDFDVTASVQAMANGQTNYGWKVESLGGNSNLKRFHSSESTVDVARRPRLIITYTVGPASP